MILNSTPLPRLMTCYITDQQPPVSVANHVILLCSAVPIYLVHCGHPQHWAWTPQGLSGKVPELLSVSVSPYK